MNQSFLIKLPLRFLSGPIISEQRCVRRRVCRCWWSCCTRMQIKWCERSPSRSETSPSTTRTKISSVRSRVAALLWCSPCDAEADGFSAAWSGSYAMRDLVSNLPCGQQRPAKNLEGDTVVAILNTILEIVSENLENARFLIQGQGIQKLVSINRTRWQIAQNALCHSNVVKPTQKTLATTQNTLCHSNEVKSTRNTLATP